ncbi:unnamed protein product, partial [Mesorhabditis belari]|uniref:NADH:flavin oxidoreductase/NADH oxidase N-terminal domain-containing protein n=1 Tax=Mesorhabditis belari TaxID=2138241 RepID=A0AAF3EUH6_9BILA
MVANRIPCNQEVDAAILGKSLPFNCGRVCRNRIVKASLSERHASFDPTNFENHGLPKESLLNIYEKWGNGGFGMVFTGNIMIDMKHLEAPGNVIVSKENDSPVLRSLLKRLASALKMDGGLAIAQLNHCGRQTPEFLNPHPKSASDVKLEIDFHGMGFGKPVPLTAAEIKDEVITRFVESAKICVEAGFDGIQVHAAHGYLLAQFMSPQTNQRTDEYGGSAENRVRIVVEVYEALRKDLPKDFIIGVKVNSVEFQEGGLETSDARVMCAKLEEIGYDFVELSGGTYENLQMHHVKESTRKREAFFLEFTDKIRPVFRNTKMFVTGGFRTVEGMVKAVESGACDGIGMGRPIASEPDLPKKILAGLAKSAPDTKVNHDIFASGAAAAAQMWQASERDFTQGNGDPCDGIADLSDENIAKEFKEALEEFQNLIERNRAAGLPVPNNGILAWYPKGSKYRKSE